VKGPAAGGAAEANCRSSLGLLEKKGIHHEGNSVQKTPSADSKGSSPERKEKKSFGQKIKAKLHRTSVS